MKPEMSEVAVRDEPAMTAPSRNLIGSAAVRPRGDATPHRAKIVIKDLDESFAEVSAV
jgi:hypothetical protein